MSESESESVGTNGDVAAQYKSEGECKSETGGGGDGKEVSTRGHRNVRYNDRDSLLAPLACAHNKLTSKGKKSWDSEYYKATP